MMCKILLVAILLASCDLVKSTAETDDSPSAKKRGAMVNALNDSTSSPIFTSAQEKRAHYYIHEGLKAAIQRSLRMANFDVDLLWDYLDESIIAEEEEDGVEDPSLAYLKFTEALLTDMIKEVENSLQILAANNDVIIAPVGGKDDDNNTDEGGRAAADDDTTEQNDSNGSDSSENESIGPAEAILKAFDNIHEDLHCDKYDNTTISDPQGKWNNLTEAYWKFFDIDARTHLNSTMHHSDDGYSKIVYTTKGNVYFDYRNNGDDDGEKGSPFQSEQTLTRGMFAARDFEQNELVYSFMANGIFFLELSKFEHFIRNATLLPELDACLLLQWSFAQKLSRPGRYYICTSLDEGAFFNSGEDEEVNVYLEDARDLRYYASRNIAAGEEIIYSSS